MLETNTSFYSVGFSLNVFFIVFLVDECVGCSSSLRRSVSKVLKIIKSSLFGCFKLNLSSRADKTGGLFAFFVARGALARP